MYSAVKDSRRDSVWPLRRETGPGAGGSLTAREPSRDLEGAGNLDTCGCRPGSRQPHVTQHPPSSQGSETNGVDRRSSHATRCNK